MIRTTVTVTRLRPQYSGVSSVRLYDPILLFMSMMIYLQQECQCAIIDFYCSIVKRCIITRNFDFYNKMGLESVYWFYDGDFIPSTFSAFVYKRKRSGV